MKDVVLRLYRRMARVPAVREARGVGGELVGLGVVVEQRVSPAAALRKALAVLLDDERLRENIRHVHREGRLGALLRLPLQLRDLRAFRERLAVAGNAGL